MMKPRLQGSNAGISVLEMGIRTPSDDAQLDMMSVTVTTCPSQSLQFFVLLR
jgi:hypothetical protein